MQFAYQFPERVERLALISSGGLGREVHPMLRAAALPGADWVLPAVAKTGALRAGAALTRLAARAGLQPTADAQGIADGWATLEDPDTSGLPPHRALDHRPRRAARGRQRQLHLAADLPVLIVWGSRDPLIPVAHAHHARALLPHSRLELFERAGHFPFRDEPARFVALLNDFMA